jgi:diphthamide biosynthesis methyltransferase
MTAAEKIAAAGYEDVVIFENYSYDDALIGVTEDGLAVYDFDKMVTWLVEKEGIEPLEAIEWIECNTIPALAYAGDDGPLIMYSL